MIPVEAAEKIILDHVQPLDATRDCERLSLEEAGDRVLAAAVTSQLDFPHWDNSAMDGYAVRFEDVQAATAASPVTLAIVEDIPAGYQPQCTVQAGQAARILTGSVMPAGADTIVIQEDTQRDGNRVTIQAAPQPKAFVRHRAAFYQAGTPLLSAGLRLQAPAIAVLAAAQCARVSVYRRPRVAILSTGDELVGIDQPLQPGQIVDSNQLALASLVAQAGAIPIRLGIVPDNPEALRLSIATAIEQADMVLSSGGVSVGDYDYVEDVLADLGGRIHIRAVAVRPGKPLTVATFEKTSGVSRQAGTGQVNPSSPILYFGLPGNPVSALVTFWRFVQPALQKLSGLPPSAWGPPFVQATARVDLRSDGKRESYLWGQLHLHHGLYAFDLAGGSHSSGNLINLAGTSGLAVLSVGQTQVKAGDSIRVLPIGSPLLNIP